MAIAYDAIIIGSEQAGAPLAVRLAGAGMRVAIIERERFGGTCVNTCCPDKDARWQCPRSSYRAARRRLRRNDR